MYLQSSISNSALQINRFVLTETKATAPNETKNTKWRKTERHSCWRLREPDAHQTADGGERETGLGEWNSFSFCVSSDNKSQDSSISHYFFLTLHIWSFLCSSSSFPSNVNLSDLKRKTFFFRGVLPPTENIVLHCCRDTVAAPVADVSRQWRHTISRPIGRSPLRALTVRCCVCKVETERMKTMRAMKAILEALRVCLQQQQGLEAN